MQLPRTDSGKTHPFDYDTDSGLGDDDNGDGDPGSPSQAQPLLNPGSPIRIRHQRGGRPWPGAEAVDGLLSGALASVPGSCKVAALALLSVPVAAGAAALYVEAVMRGYVQTVNHSCYAAFRGAQSRHAAHAAHASTLLLA